MGYGYLKFQIHTGDDALPIANARITVCLTNGKVVYKTSTDQDGNTEDYKLPAPDVRYTLDPNYKQGAYSLYDADIEASGYVTKHVKGIPVVDTQTTILPENMLPLAEEVTAVTDEYIDIPPVSLLLPVRNRQSETPPIADDEGYVPDITVPDENQTAFLAGDVLIPDYITVHLGIPTNASARNVRVRFSDYIKNVVSSEIYSTWPINSLEANIHAIVTFALNRVFTEWYRSRNYPFDITNSTSYDMYYRDGGPIYQNISNLVDKMFTIYARRIGFKNPFFTQFCNGTTSTCNGLSQWGTVALANQGKSPLEILRYYYPRDLELTKSSNIGGISSSFPGYTLRAGSTGESVRRMQNYLNRIRINYPLIPEISNPNGVFGNDTTEAVRTFQRTFNMNADGLIGEATWNKITFIFVAVTRLAELNSEGLRLTIGANPPTSIISQGSTGDDVVELQFLLNLIGAYYPSVPTVLQNSVFDKRTKNSVIEFQKTFGLYQDGVVGPTTWRKLYSVYNGIQNNAQVPPVSPGVPETSPTFPGTPLKRGSTGANVRTMQSYLNVIGSIYPTIPRLVADGVFGAKTEEAVKLFQQATFLNPDGIIGLLTWNKIVEEFGRASGNVPISLDFPGTPLRIGSTGPSVRLMQLFLSELRSPYPSLPLVTVDGVFGPNTEAAVRGFQRIFGLTQDGVIGPITWYEIIRQRNAAV